MLRVRIAADFTAWREAARAALAAGYLPAEITFEDEFSSASLDLGLESAVTPNGVPFMKPCASAEFLRVAERISTHRDERRWNLLYRLLYRLQSERDLLRIEVDDDVAYFKRMDQQIGKEIHKMHAFVRFRKIEELSDAGDSQEHFIAFYEPQHRILPLAAAFFAERFAVMRWTIMTPDATVSWNPETKQLTFGEGVMNESAPQSDDLETLWRSYYGAIFNPARLNPRAMRSDMPLRFWKHLPELEVLPELMQRAEARVAVMVTKQSAQPTATPFVPEQHNIAVLRAAMPDCKGCELYKHATQVVPGAGGGSAKLMIVGEQPGDQEDRQGAPFVGPAGGVLHRALQELSIDMKQVFVTNAVKHFKFVPRGKFRLHKSPDMREINACRPWLEAELDAVRPNVVVCMGASAAKSLLGGTFRLMESHGVIQTSKYAERVMATVHPSAVLRATDEEGRAKLYSIMKDDLKLAYEAALAVK